MIHSPVVSHSSFFCLARHSLGLNEFEIESYFFHACRRQVINNTATTLSNYFKTNHRLTARASANISFPRVTPNVVAPKTTRNDLVRQVTPYALFSTCPRQAWDMAPNELFPQSNDSRPAPTEIKLNNRSLTLSLNIIHQYTSITREFAKFFRNNSKGLSREDLGVRENELWQT